VANVASARTHNSRWLWITTALATRYLTARRPGRHFNRRCYLVSTPVVQAAYEQVFFEAREKESPRAAPCPPPPAAGHAPPRQYLTVLNRQ